MRCWGANPRTTFGARRPAAGERWRTGEGRREGVAGWGAARHHRSITQAGRGEGESGRGTGASAGSPPALPATRSLGLCHVMLHLARRRFAAQQEELVALREENLRLHHELQHGGSEKGSGPAPPHCQGGAQSIAASAAVGPIATPCCTASAAAAGGFAQPRAGAGAGEAEDPAAEALRAQVSELQGLVNFYERKMATLAEQHLIPAVEGNSQGVPQVVVVVVVVVGRCGAPAAPHTVQQGGEGSQDEVRGAVGAPRPEPRGLDPGGALPRGANVPAGPQDGQALQRGHARQLAAPRR